MNETVSIIMTLIGMVVLMLMGVHVFVALGISGIIGLLILFHGELSFVAQMIWQTTNDFTWVAITLFLFMGEMVTLSGASQRLFKGAEVLIGRFPGGLNDVTILACAIFSACSGSSVATAAAIGSVAIPEFKKRGYDPALSLGTVCVGGTLGILIPPSITMIVYGLMTGTSVGKLFMAGVIPGIMMAIIYILYNAARVLINPSLVPNTGSRSFTLLKYAQAILDLAPMTLLAAAVLGSIYLGVATPNEAAAIGAVGALAIGIIYRSITWRLLLEGVRKATLDATMIIFLVLGAVILSLVLSHSGITRTVVLAFIEAGLPPWAFYTIFCIIYLIMGCFFEGMTIMILTIPLMYPVAAKLGFDLIWFGIPVVILIELALITPPFGMNLFVIDGLVGGGQFGTIVRGVMPFVVLLIFALVLLYFFPQIALWLPNNMSI